MGYPGAEKCISIWCTANRVLRREAEGVVQNQMDDNEILVTCIGESTLLYLGRDNITRLSVELLPGIGEAHILVAPKAEDVESHLRMLDKFAEVEDMYADEVSMTIRLVPRTSPEFEVIGARELAFSA